MEIVNSNFYDKYELLADNNSVEKFSKAIANKTCRLCGQTSPEVQFDNEPHFIPQLLGRNNFSSNFECDKCNNTFARFETDLSIFILPFTTLLNLKTKNGVPTFKSRRENIEKSTIIKVEDNNRSIFVENAADFVIDRELKEATLTVRRQKANPVNIYKSLARIGILLMPARDIANCQEFIDWLINKNDSYNKNSLLVSRNMLVDKYYDVPVAQLFKIKDPNFKDFLKPQYILVVRAANLIFQVIYPMTVGLDPKAKLLLDLLPDVILYNESAFYKLFDLSENCQTLDEELKFSFEN
jgi:hypothetical protein